jgi:serine protease Do
MNTKNDARGRDRPLRLVRWLAVGALAAVMGAVPTGGATAQSADGGPEFADAVAEASLAYVQVDWSGYIVFPRRVDVSDVDGVEYFPAGTVIGPIEVSTSCSGFVASSAGEIVTAGHCVDAESYDGGKGAIVEAFVAQDTHIGGEPLSPAERSLELDILQANADVEGADSGAPPDRTVTVTVPAAETESSPASVVDVQSFEEGDVALLRATGVDAPVLPVASAEPENGDDVVAAGYSGSVADVVDAATPASFKEGSISGTQTVNGTPFTEISAGTSAGMSGGPVLDMDGMVVGTVSWAPTGSDVSADFITSAGSVRSLLASNGVDNTMSEADEAYRQGLSYYFDSRYHDAVAQFDQALALQPGLTMAGEFRQKAVASYPDDVNPPSTGLPPWAYVAIGTVLLVLAAGAGLYLVRRRRTGRAGEEPVVTVPQPVPPEPALVAKTGPEGQGGPGTAGETHHLFCANCGTEHTEEAHYCEQCGQPFPAALPAEHGKG